MTPPAGLRACPGPPAGAYDVALLDLDGVVYRGPHAVEGAAAALDGARAAGMRLAYVTNNASRTPEAVAAHLRALGMAAGPDDVVTSAQAAARLVTERFGRGVPVLVIGGEGARRALAEVGAVLVDSAADDPEVVVQGFDAGLRYADLAEAALAVRAGAWWVATNRDLTLPTERGLQPGNGALVGAVAAAVGHGPAAFAGKPDPALLAEARRRTGATRPLVVGDRLDTDVEGAVVAGVDSLWVLTGVASGSDLVAAPPRQRPSYVGRGLDALLCAHAAPEPAGGGWRCGGWTARADGDTVTASTAAGTDPANPADPADPVDLLRAVAAAAWAAADAGAPVRRLRVPAERRGDVGAVRLDALYDGLLTAAGGAVG